MKIASYSLLTKLAGQELPQNEIIELAMKNPSAGVLGMIFFATVIGAPLMEEFIFRGTIYPGLKSVIGGPAAALSSSIVFALLHPMLDCATIFVLGLLLVYVYERTGTLWASIALHATNNFITTILVLSMVL